LTRFHGSTFRTSHKQHRASGLSATFGGTGTTYVQRRGAERVLFTLTVWISVAFFVIAVALMYI
jgi:protein translocase SecG subunit